MSKIHPTAIVEDGATLGEDVEIGPYAHVGRDVRLGNGVTVGQGAIVEGHSTIGERCQIFPYALIGMKTQDLKYVEGSTSYVEIGDRSVIREFTTVHLGTKDGEKTVIGRDCLIMAYCHAALGVVIGDHVIMSNNAQLAGDVHVDEWAIIGGMAGTHHYDVIVVSHDRLFQQCVVRQNGQGLVFVLLHDFTLTRSLVVDATQVQHAMDDDPHEFGLVGDIEHLGIAADGV